MSKLSDDARCVAGGWFGVGLTEVICAMREWRPTTRTQAAIEELVKAKIVSRGNYGARGFILRPLVDCEGYGRWLKKNRSKGEWPLMEEVVK